MRGPLLILALFAERERGDKKKLPKAVPGRQKCRIDSKSDHDEKKASRFVSCSLNEIHYHEDSMTDLTRPGSLPCEELQSYPSSKRLDKGKVVLPRKSGKISLLRHNFQGNYAAELHNFLGNHAAAAKLPSCRIYSMCFW